MFIFVIAVISMMCNVHSCNFQKNNVIIGSVFNNFHSCLFHWCCRSGYSAETRS